MTSQRHRQAIAILRHDAHRLTSRERELLGLPARPSRKPVEPPPFPANPADYVWFALTVTPQGEALAVQALSRAGFVAFNPTEVVMARSSRIVKFKRKERERALLTSTVLVGFRGRWVSRMRDGKPVDVFHADVPWLRVLEVDRVTGVIGMGEGPVPVPLINVLMLRERCGQRGATRNWSASVGDTVEITFGAFQSQHGRVVDLVDGKAKVMLFGGSGVLAHLAAPLAVPETWVGEVVDVVGAAG